MDEALKAAWRAAQAAPDDAQARATYGQALRRVGHRLAAALELGDAHRLATGKVAFVLREAAIERPLRPGGPTLRWFAPVRPAGLEGVTPPSLPDARLGHVHVTHQADVHAIAALVPWPACPDCVGRRAPGEDPLGNGLTECERCEGRGEFIEFTGRAEERLPCETCGGTGRVPCARCDGAGFVPRRGRSSRCDHEALGAPLVDLNDADRSMGLGSSTLDASWSVHRCSTCGLCVLRDPAGDLHPACAGCGTFACDGTCDEGVTRESGSDP